MAAYTTIDNPELYFQVVLYTGNGAANNAITLPGDEDMQPDLVWIKNRDATDSHCLFDAVRGATYVIHSNATTTSAVDADTLDSFTSDGFQVDADVKVNTNTEDYVAWCWKAGTTSGISGSADITPSAYSFNQTSGFSIIKYTGDLTANGVSTVLHGLGAKPDLVISKTTTGATSSWGVVSPTSKGMTSEDYVLHLDLTNAELDTAGSGDISAPTTTVYGTNYESGININAETFIAYIFRNVQGFSKVGTYEGNNNANGPFVYTGFRPALVISRSLDSTSDWHLTDNKRLGYNSSNSQLFPSTTAAENSTQAMDLLSNGFKLGIVGDPNVAETFVYIAFAEAPFVNSEGVPCNAR